MKYVANPIEVDVFEITAVFKRPIEPNEPSEYGVHVALSNHQELTFLSPGMCARYTPRIGDYYVVQEDGYAYINPKKVLEHKYRPAAKSN